MARLVVVDHPILAEGTALVLQQQLGAQVATTRGDPRALAPLSAVVLLEHFLPDQQRGLHLARQLLHARPDLICILWTRQPLPLHLWAGWTAGLHGFLDKAMPVADICYWLELAHQHRAAWPAHLLAQAREWDTAVALRLKTLTCEQWQVWARLVHGQSNAEIVQQLGWSRRTVERKLDKLYESLGVQRRAEALGAAWKWGLVKAGATGPAWSSIVLELFPVSQAAR